MMAGEINAEEAGFFALCILAFYLYQKQKATVAANQPGAVLQKGLAQSANNLLQTAEQSLFGALGGGGPSGATSPSATGSAPVYGETGQQILQGETTGTSPLAGYNSSTGDTTEEDARLLSLEQSAAANDAALQASGAAPLSSSDASALFSDAGYGS